VPKYDAFGREIGEDTLAGLGGGSEVKPTPVPAEATWQQRIDQTEATWEAAERIEVARIETAADAADAKAERTEDARQQAAGDSRWTAPVTPAPSGRKQPLTITLPVSQQLSSGTARRRARRVLVLVVIVIIAVFAIPLLIAGFAIVNTVGDATREIDGAIKIARPELPKAAPTGLAGASLVRQDRFGPAMRRLQEKGYGRLTNVRVAPERINAQFLTKDGALLNVQLDSDGKLQSFGKSGTGFKSATIPFSRVDAAAPERLTRRSAERLGKTPKQLDYMVLTQGGPKGNLWAVFFKGGGNIQGFPDGRIWRRVS
jgi:hypothetical protein